MFVGAGGVADELTGGSTELAAQPVEVAVVEDDAFESFPVAVDEDLDPGVQDFLGCEAVEDSGDDSFLEAFVDGGGVETAGDVDGA